MHGEHTGHGYEKPYEEAVGDDAPHDRPSPEPGGSAAGCQRGADESEKNTERDRDEEPLSGVRTALHEINIMKMRWVARRVSLRNP